MSNSSVIGMRWYWLRRPPPRHPSVQISVPWEFRSRPKLDRVEVKSGDLYQSVGEWARTAKKKTMPSSG